MGVRYYTKITSYLIKISEKITKNVSVPRRSIRTEECTIQDRLVFRSIVLFRIIVSTFGTLRHPKKGQLRWHVKGVQIFIAKLAIIIGIRQDVLHLVDPKDFSFDTQKLILTSGFDHNSNNAERSHFWRWWRWIHGIISGK